MRAQHIVGFIVDACRETVRILFADHRGETIGITLHLHRAVRPGHPVLIGRNLFSRNQSRIIPGLVRKLHFHFLSRIGKHKLHLLRIRPERLKHDGISRRMRPKQSVGIVLL